MEKVGRIRIGAHRRLDLYSVDIAVFSQIYKASGETSRPKAIPGIGKQISAAERGACDA